MQCRFCGQGLAPQASQAYGAPPGYGAHHGAAHGHGQAAYGAPPGGFGAPQGYGPPSASPYGGPQPNMYGGPQPYGGSHLPVTGFGGAQAFHHGHVHRSGWSSGLSTFFWVRLAIAAVAIGISLIGACVSAIAH